MLFDAISIENSERVKYIDDVRGVRNNYVQTNGGDRVYYYNNDNLSTPQVMTDITGNIVWKADYKPFWEGDILVETIEINFRMPRKIYITESGLQYNWHRYYLERTGRFNATDRFLFQR